MYIMAYTHRRHRRGRRAHKGRKHTQKGGIFKWLSSKLEDATAAVTNAVSGKKEEEQKETSVAMVPPLRGMKGGHAMPHYGGFFGGLKGHFNKVKAAAASHVQAMKTKSAPMRTRVSGQVAATGAALKAHAANLASAVKAHPMGAKAAGHLARFNTAVQAHVAAGTEATKKAVHSTGQALVGHMDRLSAASKPALAKAKGYGMQAKAATRKAGFSLLKKASGLRKTMKLQ